MAAVDVTATYDVGGQNGSPQGPLRSGATGMRNPSARTRISVQ